MRIGSIADIRPSGASELKRVAALFLLFASMAVSSLAQVGQKAAAFTLTDFQGRSIKLSDYKGKVVLLGFWATWCVPCQTEMPRFIDWQNKYGPMGLQVIAVSMDDDEKAARKFVRRLKVNYPITMATAALAESYGGVLGLPANFIIDREGRIVAKHVGETDLKVIETEIRDGLAGNK